MKKGIIISLIILVIIVGLGVGAGFYIYKNILNIDSIYSGITIDGLDLGGMTREEAIAYLQSSKSSDLDRAMELKGQDQTYQIKLRDLDFSYNYEETVDQAYSLGRQGSPLARLKEIRNLKNGLDLSLESFYDRDNIDRIVGEISQDMGREAQDAVLHFKDGKFTVTEEVIGRRLAEDRLYEMIEANVEELKIIELPIEEIRPQMTKDFLSRINGVIGEYSTSFKGSSKGRIENIRLSAQAISNKLILPGQDFSYNNTTGPRSAQAGYQEANVIIGGELTPGLGGGVCQTSTTMYNALLLSDLTIVERSPHSIPANYVPYGQDAAVSYGYLDLRFRNDFDFPIYTHTKIVGDRLYIYIYGDAKSKDYSIKIEPQIVETIHPQTEEIQDDKLGAGVRETVQKGRTGYKVHTFKSIIRDGKVITKKQISTDHYRKKNNIYKIGVGGQEEGEGE